MRVSFQEIEGQERALTLLRRAVSRGTVASGYLFVGPDGVGKARAALALGQALECEARPEGEPDGCGQCSACRRVLSKSHPDLHWVSPDGAFIKIDQIRELKGRLSLRAHEGKVKLAVIEEAEKMHPAAANALLKTLEEPSADTRFVLLAKSPRFVLPTIRSRCQAVTFVPLSDELIAELLIRRGAEPEAAKTAARLAEGSVGRAAQALEESSEWRGRVELARKIEAAVSAQDPLVGLGAAEELAKGVDRQEAAQILELLARFYRDVMAAAAGAKVGDQKARARADELGVSRALACLEATNAARDSLLRNGNALLVAEGLVFTLRRHTGATRTARR